METTTKKLYEAMFLVDSAQAGSDWDGTLATINRVLEREWSVILFWEVVSGSERWRPGLWLGIPHGIFSMIY